MAHPSCTTPRNSTSDQTPSQQTNTRSRTLIPTRSRRSSRRTKHSGGCATFWTLITVKITWSPSRRTRCSPRLLSGFRASLRAPSSIRHNKHSERSSPRPRDSRPWIFHFTDFQFFCSIYTSFPSTATVVQRFGIFVLTRHMGTRDLVMLHFFYMHNFPYPFGNRVGLCYA